MEVRPVETPVLAAQFTQYLPFVDTPSIRSEFRRRAQLVKESPGLAKIGVPTEEELGGCGLGRPLVQLNADFQHIPAYYPHGPFWNIRSAWPLSGPRCVLPTKTWPDTEGAWPSELTDEQLAKVADAGVVFKCAYLTGVLFDPKTRQSHPVNPILHLQMQCEFVGLLDEQLPTTLSAGISGTQAIFVDRHAKRPVSAGEDLVWYIPGWVPALRASRHATARLTPSSVEDVFFEECDAIAKANNDSPYCIRVQSKAAAMETVAALHEHMKAACEKEIRANPQCHHMLAAIERLLYEDIDRRVFAKLATPVPTWGGCRVNCAL